MKKLIWFSIAVLVFATTLVGCTLNSPSSSDSSNKETSDTHDQLKIVTTIFPEYDFTRAIVGNQCELKMLVKPGSEVHSYDPSPTDIVTIQNADVFIYNGGDSEAWVDSILESMDTSGKKIICLMDAVSTVEEEAKEGMDPGEEEHSNGEVEYDQHIWTSPKNAIIMTNTIADALCQVDKAHASTYQKNATAYTSEIQKIDKEIQKIVDDAPQKIIVLGDRFPFRYFVDEFGLDYRAAFNGCGTGTEVSAATMAYLIDTIKKENLSSVFYIELSNQTIANAISEQTGAQTLLLHSCQNLSKDDFEKGATYVSLMQQNAKNLKRGLE